MIGESVEAVRGHNKGFIGQVTQVASDGQTVHIKSLNGQNEVIVNTSDVKRAKLVLAKTDAKAEQMGLSKYDLVSFNNGES